MPRTKSNALYEDSLLYDLDTAKCWTSRWVLLLQQITGNTQKCGKKIKIRLELEHFPPPTCFVTG